MPPALPRPVPELPVENLERAVAYYASRLGFTIDWNDPTIGLAGLSSGSCRLFLASADFRKGRGTAGPALTWLNLDSNDDVDALFRAWEASAAIVLERPESKPWGLREFTVADPDGNQFRVFHDFATPARRAAGC
ncbi:MAG: VOC family protein [Gemmatimonadaceae bacterium]|nr:VOC family protein [Gemmatimonadaceae bacterium]